MLKKSSWVLAGLAGWLGPVALALADEKGHGEEEVSVFAGDFGNALFTLVIFVLVLVVLAKFAWKPLLTALQNREKFIRDSLEAARRDRQEYEQRLRDLETRMNQARDEANALVEEGRRDAEQVKRRIEDEARKSADALIDRAKREIGIARDSALKDLYDQSSQLAMTMAGSVLRRQLGPEDEQRLIADALAELSARGDGQERTAEGRAS
jgi:F-type H+-transporting ATPase subunit b